MYLYGKLDNNIITQYLKSNKQQDSLGIDWLKLDNNFLNNRPSDFHKYNTITDSWEIDSVNLTEPQWEIVKLERNQLLQSSDWTQLPDVPLSTKENWAVYRQALRDITNQPDPFNITWPQPPN